MIAGKLKLASGKESVMSEKKSPLTAGFYLGMFCNIKNFSLSEPKILNPGTTVGSLEDLFEDYQNRSTARRGKPSGDGNSTKFSQVAPTTTSSGWVRLDGISADSVKTKTDVLPQLIKEAGIEDPFTADLKVKEFKQFAARTLAANVDKKDEEVIQAIRLINTHKCIAGDVRVKLLRVSETPFQGSRESNGLHFGEILMRRFYVCVALSTQQLEELTKLIVDPNHSVETERHFTIQPRVDSRSGKIVGHTIGVASNADADSAEVAKIVKAIRNKAKVAKT